MLFNATTASDVSPKGGPSHPAIKNTGSVTASSTIKGELGKTARIGTSPGVAQNLLFGFASPIWIAFEWFRLDHGRCPASGRPFGRLWAELKAFFAPERSRDTQGCEFPIALHPIRHSPTERPWRRTGSRIALTCPGRLYRRLVKAPRSGVVGPAPFARAT